jgi:hypothetical protein
MYCLNCGEEMEGDGYTVVFHCPNVDVIEEGYEPDAAPVYCGNADERLSEIVKYLNKGGKI